MNALDVECDEDGQAEHQCGACRAAGEGKGHLSLLEYRAAADVERDPEHDCEQAEQRHE